MAKQWQQEWQNNPTYLAKVAVTRFNYAFLLFDSIHMK